MTSVSTIGLTTAGIAVGTGLFSMIGSSDGGETHYYQQGKPNKPNDAKLIRRDIRNVKSQQFKDFIRNKNRAFKQSEWKKVMETWQTKSGRLVERHYWRNISGESWYHN